MPTSRTNREPLPLPLEDESGVHRRRSEPVPTLRLEWVGATHTGKRRKKNEDRFGSDEGEGLFVVADGMGGHAAGEVAAEFAVQSILGTVTAMAFDPNRTLPYALDTQLSYDEARLQIAFRVANERVQAEAAAHPRWRGMGTTAVALLAGHDGFFLANVGDSRGYLYRDGVLTRVTEDHTLYNEMVKTGAAPPGQESTSAQRNVLMRALGTDRRLVTDVHRVDARPGDVFLLCSDGLHGVVEDADIASILKRAKSLDRAAAQLIDEANALGGPDNVTVVLVRRVAESSPPGD